MTTTEITVGARVAFTRPGWADLTGTVYSIDDYERTPERVRYYVRLDTTRQTQSFSRAQLTVIQETK